MKKRKFHHLSSKDGKLGTIELTHNHSSDYTFNLIHDHHNLHELPSKYLEAFKTLKDNKSLMEIYSLANNIGENLSREKLFNKIRNLFKRVIFLEDEKAYDVLSLWVISTYTYPLYTHIFYIALLGLAGSGKTELLQLCFLLANNSIKASGADSMSSLKRINSIVQGTLLIDEAQGDLSNPKSEIHKLFAIGNTKGGTVKLSKTNADGGYDPDILPAYYSKLLSCREFANDEAMLRRSYIIPMPRITNDKLIELESSFSQQIEEEAQLLKNDLVTYALKRKAGIIPPRKLSETEWEYAYKNLNPSELQNFKIVLDETLSSEHFYSIIDNIMSNRSSKNYENIDVEFLLAIKNNKSDKGFILLSEISKAMGIALDRPFGSKDVGNLARQHGFRTIRKSNGTALTKSPKLLEVHLKHHGIKEIKHEN